MTKFFYIITFLLLIGLPANSQNKTDELDKLFLKLKKEQNITVASKIESEIWKLWTTHPSEPSLTELLAEGSYYMSQNQLDNAHKIFSKAIELNGIIISNKINIFFIMLMFYNFFWYYSLRSIAHNN